MLGETSRPAKNWCHTRADSADESCRMIFDVARNYVRRTAASRRNVVTADGSVIAKPLPWTKPS